jgi:hypothetical protein
MSFNKYISQLSDREILLSRKISDFRVKQEEKEFAIDFNQ